MWSYLLVKMGWVGVTSGTGRLCDGMGVSVTILSARFHGRERMPIPSTQVLSIH